MSSRSLNLTEELYAYLQSNITKESDALRALREYTHANVPASVMQISPEQGAFMGLLITIMGAKKTIEVGTFTGYSALVVAEKLPEDGKLIACDVSKTWTDIAQLYWEKANVASKIELHLRPATETLDELIADGHEGSFDFGFIDADKNNYDAYYESVLRLLRQGGVVAIDNVLRGGRVAMDSVMDEDTQALRALNQKLGDDSRVHRTMLPIGDGLTLAVKL